MIIKNVLFSSGKLIRCGPSERLSVEQQVPEGIAIGVVIVHCVMECVLESSIGFYGRSPFFEDGWTVRFSAFFVRIFPHSRKSIGFLTCNCEIKVRRIPLSLKITNLVRFFQSLGIFTAGVCS